MTRGAVRLHITGGSGSGTTSLGRALATVWSVPHADSDDYFWLPTALPYTEKRDPAERVRLMEEIFLGRDAWVLSGSLVGWGEPVVPRFEAVVLLGLDAATRLARLRERERRRYGARIEPGGDREGDHGTFLAWAQGYDDPAFDGRSQRGHEVWLRQLTCPVLRLDATPGVDELATTVTDWIDTLPR